MLLRREDGCENDTWDDGDGVLVQNARLPSTSSVQATPFELANTLLLLVAYIVSKTKYYTATSY